MLISHILLSTKLKEKDNKTKSSRPCTITKLPKIMDVYGSNNYEKDKDSKQMQQ